MSYYYDSDKSNNTRQVNDFVTLDNYHHSFFTMPRLSDLRMSIAPGSSAYFNKTFLPEAIQPKPNTCYTIPTQLSSAGAVVPVQTNDPDYLSYPKERR
jgi:hypothetical protein